MSAAAKMGLFGGAGEKHITHNCKWMMCDFYFNKSTMVRSNLSVPIQQVFLTKGHGHPLFCRIHEHLAVLITCFSPSRPIRQPSMGLPGNTSFSFSASAISSYCIHPPPPTHTIQCNNKACGNIKGVTNAAKMQKYSPPLRQKPWFPAAAYLSIQTKHDWASLRAA